MKLLVWLVLPALLFPVDVCMAQDQKIWTLPALLEHALQHRDDIAARREIVRKAGIKVKEMFSHYLPRIHLTSSYTVVQTQLELDLSSSTIEDEIPTVAGPVPINVKLPDNVWLADKTVADLGVTLVQPLFGWGRISNYIQAAQKKEAYEKSELKQTQIDVISQVRQAYFSFLVARQAQIFAATVFHELKVVKKLLQTIIAQNDGQNTSPVSSLDIMAVEEYLLHARGMTLKTKDMQRTALEYLSFASGIPERLDAQAVALFNPDDLEFKPLPEYISAALANHPAMQSVDSGIAVYNHLEKAEEAARLPALGLMAFYETYGNKDTALKKDHYYGGAVVLSMPIFDGGEIKAKAHQHSFQAKSLEKKREFLMKYLVTTTTAAYLDVMSLKELLELDEKEARLIEKRCKLARFGLTTGLTSYRDHKDAYTLRVQRKQEYFERLIDFYEKVTELYKIVGEKTVPGI
ncbi:MAG: TolC family protein [bacterium]|nr:TolC family protein [bacterium]